MAAEMPVPPPPMIRTYHSTRFVSAGEASSSLLLNMLPSRFHGLLKSVFILGWRRISGFVYHGDGFRRASGGANRASKAPVKVDFRHIIGAHDKGFGGASFKAGLAGRAQIRIKPGLKTRIESQTGFGLLKGHLNSNAMPAVTIAEKFHTFFHVLAHVDKTGFLRSIQNPLASSLLIILAPSLSMAYCPIGPNSIQTSLGMPWRSSPRKSAAWRQ